MRLAAGLLIGLSLAWGNSAMATAEPSFTVRFHQQDPDVELRSYPALVAADVTVRADRDQAGNAGFRILAGYIFGGNEGARSIAMTAPVVTSPAAGVSIAMTAPVTQTPAGAGAGASAGAWTIRFYMPAGYTLATLPTPKDARIHLVDVPPAEVAVIRFSGLSGEADVAERTRQLQGIIAAHHWTAVGAPSLARYNPPWTLWFLRRNEVWIPVTTAAVE